MENSAQTSFRAASQPFVPGDRVVIDYAPAGAFDRKAGKIIRVVFKERPRYGKTPGWWVTVRCDPPKGIKKMECEIHASHVKPESDFIV